ncbi:MAG: hypothetical protein KA319_13515 [Ferruginibacter sp.]|nr:hypothetical protein [Ferruginibacter sp.]
MNTGLKRFEYFLQQVEALLNKAAKQRNASAWLFKNNARTPFFMLEGLAKVYTELHNKKKFTKLKEHFKLIEDGLGAVDYYQSLVEYCTTNKNVPIACKQYFAKMVLQKNTDLNLLLVEKGWINADGKRLNKIKTKLQDADWLIAKKEVEEIAAFYGESIYNINEFVTETKYHFDNVEEDVHELRRKLRWLSIYPHAFCGAIQFSTTKATAPHLKKYMTSEILKSPFNTFPLVDDNKNTVQLNKGYFLALSWVIAKLGSLKDEGLIITELKEAIQQTSSCTDDEAYAKAYTILGKKYKKLTVILDEAEAITKTFFTENNLENLVNKVS